MFAMRKLLALAVVALVAVPSVVEANGLIMTGHRQYDQYGFRKGHGPRAAPWYMYWPYEMYFNMPAPTGAPFGPSHMSPGQFSPHMYQGQQFMPHHTNGFGQ
jgi:hypothetical protein